MLESARMTDFTLKPLMKTATLGERLREVRTEARASVREAAEATGVSVHHLEALEAGEYSRLPGDVYTRNFLRRYARYLKLNDESVMRYYESERTVLKPAERRLPGPLHSGSSVTLSLLARRSVIGLGILAILGYLGWELGKIVTPPSLVLESPAQSGITHAATIEVRGQTDPEASVFLNGQSIFVAEDGSFRELVDLTSGRNSLQVTAVKKRGKRYTISRDVILEGPFETPSTQPVPTVNENINR